MKSLQKSNNRFNLKSILINKYSFTFVLLFILIIFTFRDLPQTFYQQDEWLGMGQIAAQGWQHIVYGSSPIGLLFGEGRPFVRVLGLIFFGNFTFNVMPLAIYAILFHLLNSFLVFLIANKLSKKYFISIIAAVFFALNSVHSQSVIWFGASFGLLPTTFFIFLSLYLNIHFLHSNKLKYLYLSIIFAFISIYFKESGLFLFLFIPLFSYLYYLNKDNKTLIQTIKKIKNKKIYGIAIIYLIVFIIYRIINQLTHSQPGNILMAQSGESLNMPLIVLLNAFIYPISTFSLIYIPPEISLPLAEEFTKQYLPFVMQMPNPDLLIQNLILLAMGVTVGLLILFIIIIIYLIKSKLRLLLQFTLIIFIISILPYVVIIKGFAYLEPRYYYITSLAAGIFLGTFAEIIFSKIKYKNVGYIIGTGILIIYFFSQYQVIHKNIYNLKLESQERINIIKTIYNIQPKLPENKNIFYISGSKDYIVPNNKLPFQQGLGYTLMVLYADSDSIPRELLNESFLWNLGSEGYKEVNGIGFGYFTSLDQLKKTLKEERISNKSVTSLYYDADKKELRDISNEIDLQ